MKLGKLPARKDAVTFKLSQYANLSALPKPPSRAGHQSLISAWGTLGNDNYGDCVWAGAAHETMLWNAEAKRAVNFTDAAVLSDYSAVTGFSPNDPSTDQGTDMQVAASYRRKTGVKDGAGKRHKVAAYLAITPGNKDQLKQAIYLFGAAGIGIEFPDYAMDEFNKGQTWHVKPGPKPAEGHYIPAIGYDSRYVYVVTWGKLQKVTWGFFAKYCDEAVVYNSAEMLNNGVSIDGFNAQQLIQDLQALDNGESSITQ